MTLLIDGFIALMLFILWSWDLPERNLLNRLVFKLKWPIQRLGLFHTWRLFSPNPSTSNYRLQFKLRLADGAVVALEPEYFRYPQQQRQPVSYRWKKLKRALLGDQALPLRISVCQYVAAEYATSAPPDQYPVEVQLVRWRQPILPLAAPATARCEPYKCRVLHTQPVNPALPPASASRVAEPVPSTLCLE